MKKCPFCAEEIQDEAVLCRHCGTSLDPATATAASPSASPGTLGGDITFTHPGVRWLLGYGTDFFGIWDRQAPGPPMWRFPKNDEGWAQAWTHFAGLERVAGVPGPARSSPSPAVITAVIVAAVVLFAVVALPTFLGARALAQDKAAQSSVRNAVAAAKTIYVDSDNYSDVSVSSMSQIEPGLSYTDGPSSGPGQVSVAVDPQDDQQIGLAALSQSGTCFYFHDNAATGSYYGSAKTSYCTGTDALGANGVSW